MRFFVMILMGTLAVPAVRAMSLVSPDGRVSCALTIGGAHPTAEVTFVGKTAFVSDLGFDVPGPLRVFSVTTNEVNGSWKPVWGFRRDYPECYRELVVRLGRAGEVAAAETLEVRCYNEGFAVRARRPLGSYALEQIDHEAVGWRFGPGTCAWGIVGGEATYDAEPVALEKLREEPYMFPLTMCLGNGTGYASVFEANVQEYPRSYLTAKDGRLSPQLLGVKEGRYEAVSPWRAVALAETPAQLVEQAYFIENLNDPCALKDTDWIRPGSCISDLGNFELRTDEVIAAADVARSLGAKYIQIDWGWYGTEVVWNDEDRAAYASRHPELKDDASWIENTRANPYRSACGFVPYHAYRYDRYFRKDVEFDVPKVVAALKTRGLGLCLYLHGAILEAYDLDELFATYEKWGVAGLKPGFVGYGSENATRFLRRLAETAARHHLWLDIHDRHLPDGFQRTWPNVMTVEGGGGEEGNHPVRQDVALPFTRCLNGPFDFTPSLFRFGKAEATKLHKLAMALVYPGPTAILRGKAREVAEKYPEAVAFLRALPWNYDATHVYDAEVARYLTVVREKDGVFYIGALTGEESHVTRLGTDFLADGTYELIGLEDDPGSVPSADCPRGYRAFTRRVRKGDVIEIAMARSGGWCGILRPVN